ncbi:Lipase-3 domain-containing protein [Mycena sanguinolenta]|uniref:Lipase-3 domain-containing protein n=1 Tax=Mycena sanguinolenta TaxID=230812 RepID=A0A8H7DLG5_9AGAR|nr:Lipase-3 domain-containing protein [Mycena sanguinolenta]
MTSMEHTITTADNTGDHGSISRQTFDELTHYFKYASSAYSPVCLRPNGNTLVLQFGNHISDVLGFIARDDDRKELVVALRGSASITDAMLDANILLVPFLTPGVSLPPKARVHAGFLAAWNTVALQITATLAAQRQLHSGHRLVVAGHSMGGALATIAAVSLLQLFPASPVMDQTRIYSYGAPRTGNEVFAEYVNAEFGARAFRGNPLVHTNDGVPTMIPTSLDRLTRKIHPGIEYWQHVDPPSPSTTLRCAAGGEDPCCSASIPSGGITPAHATYLGITVPTPFCL